LAHDTVSHETAQHLALVLNCWPRLLLLTQPSPKPPRISQPQPEQEDAGQTGARKPMSEGYTIDGADDEVAGIVVRHDGERGYRFHAATRHFDALHGHVFVTPAAAQRAARDFARVRQSRRGPSANG
jgi:hypothetical protein